MLNVGVIGAGAMGANHVRVYAELDDVNLVAIADPVEERAQRLARRCGANHYTHHRDMLDRESLDIVSIVVPTTQHAEVARDCAQAGVHFFVEKPIASTLEEAWEMMSLAAARGLRMTVGHVERFNPAIRELKCRLLRGELGRAFQIHARRLGPFPERVRDVGVVIDLATHDIDVMRYLTDSEPLRVYAETEQRVHTEHEDLLSGVLKFANGAIGVLDINWLTPTKIRELTVTGERGMFLANYVTQDLYFYENNVGPHGWSPTVPLLGVSEGNMLKLRINREEPLKLELAAFVSSVSKGCEPEVRGEDAVAALIIAQAIVRSGEMARTISIRTLRTSLPVLTKRLVKLGELV